MNSVALSGSTAAMFELELVNVTKVFEKVHGGTVALRNVSLAVRPGEFVAIVGPSGCGKTTLLRILAGLTRATHGEARTGSSCPWRRDGHDGDVNDRFGVVFQDPALLPWYTVEENIALPLRLQGVGKDERRAQAREWCRRVGLAAFASAWPRELSGGMRQRAALARALIRRPGVLLMDEPFGALDALTREKMNLELQALAVGATVLFVTHSIREAVFLADRVVLLSPRPGRVRAEVEVDFPRPRRPGIEEHPRYQRLVRDLRGWLEQED